MRYANMALVQVGTMALRDSNGNFLPGVPIYREQAETPQKTSEYIPVDELAEIFADRFKAYKAARKKVHKEKNL